MKRTEGLNNKNDLLEKIKEVEIFWGKIRQNERMDKIFKNTLRVFGTGAAAFVSYLSYKHFLEGEEYEAVCGAIVTASSLFLGHFGYDLTKEIYDMYLTPKDIKEYKKNKEKKINLN